VHQEVVARTRVVGARVQPGEAVGDRVHAHQQFALEAEPRQIIGDRAADQVDEGALQLRPDVPVGDLLDRARLLQPGRRQVGPQRRDLHLHRLVGGHVAGREEPLQLRPGRRAVGAEEQVRRSGTARGGQEVVRVAAQHRDVEVEGAQQLRRHQAEQVGAGGLAQAGHLGERALGAGGAAEHLRGLEHHHVEAGAGQQHRGDQAVVTGPDDHHVRAFRQRGHEDRG
jgi:hypothetical protein